MYKRILCMWLHERGVLFACRMTRFFAWPIQPSKGPGWEMCQTAEPVLSSTTLVPQPLNTKEGLVYSKQGVLYVVKQFVTRSVSI